MTPIGLTDRIYKTSEMDTESSNIILLWLGSQCMRMSRCGREGGGGEWLQKLPLRSYIVQGHTWPGHRAIGSR